jgi:cystinosin
MAGGILSMTQQLLDAYIAKDMTVITGNPIKIGLGLASIAFDIIFILQHHVWYPSTLQTVSDEVVFNNEESEEQPLLAP